ncbi:MAG TPA: aminoacyl-tRNA hydrolase [Rhodocyclaceae bacterium]|nr:aminoacyl-tRNA hydrolase [Rhodocyclaceae bacterium]
MNATVAPKLIVGLGNPGAEYAETRHNVGFWFVDRLARELKVSLAPQAKFHGLAGRFGETWLLMPSTYMNRSGQSVSALARFYKIQPAETLVIHDELDLAPGEIRLKFGGGNAGHNGLKDITAHYATPDFWRLRLGIGHPGDRAEVSNYVLNRPRAEEQEAIEQALDRCLLAWPKMASGDYVGAMALLHPKPIAKK